jgi:2-keto-4-pentenoate hydratase
MADPVWEDPRVVRGMEEQFERLDRAIANGARSIGWKLAFGLEATQASLGITGPAVGFLTDGTLVDSGAVCSLAGWSRPMLEPEVVVRLRRDLPPGAGAKGAADAIESLAPAIELADVDPPPSADRLAEAIAGDLYHRHLVLGPGSDATSGTDTEDLRVTVEAGGQDRAATAEPERATGKIVDLIAHVADYVAAFGRRLEAGQIVICGSTVPPIEVAPGDHFLYRLDPVGAIEVGLSE